MEESKDSERGGKEEKEQKETGKGEAFQVQETK